MTYFIISFLSLFVVNNILNFISIYYDSVLLFVLQNSIISIFLVLFIDILFKISSKQIVNKILCYSIILFVLSILNFLISFDSLEELFPKYSNFFEQNYVDPKNAEITSPINKRNLILIYLESMDYSVIDYVSKHYDLELLDIAKYNLSFTNYVSGPFQNWTQSSLLATTTGIQYGYNGAFQGFDNLFKGKININKKESKTFAKKVYSIYQILKDYGYSLFFLQGGSLQFSETDMFLKNHGFEDGEFMGLYEISKYYKNYTKDKKWWGYLDRDVYEILKNKLIEYSNKQPFFITMFTLDTHLKKGDNSESFKKECEYTVKEASLLLSNFLVWLNKQDFAKKTTVVIIGDHERSGHNFTKINTNNKKIYNVFVNSLSNPLNKNRTFNQIDIFPTILESIGFKIDKGRLGLGTSLYSTQQTLIEKFGFKKLKKLLRYKSTVYNNLWID